MGTAQWIFGRALQIVGLGLVGRVIYEAIVHDLDMGNEMALAALGTGIFFAGHLLLKLGGDR